MQSVQYALDVVKTLGLALFVVVCGNSALMLIVIVGLGVSGVDVFSPDQQLGCELFVLVPDAWCKA